jgi:hypothetical protein
MKSIKKWSFPQNYGSHPKPRGKLLMSKNFEEKFAIFPLLVGGNFQKNYFTADI